jgi:hypothetical protein
MREEMASEGIGRAASEKGVEVTEPVRLREQHQDVEALPGMVNVDRIEKVYA